MNFKVIFKDIQVVIFSLMVTCWDRFRT